jgi:hypothetical protein
MTRSEFVWTLLVVFMVSFAIWFVAPPHQAPKTHVCVAIENTCE